MTNHLQRWQDVADDAISVLMVEPQRWADVIDVGLTADDLPPGNWRACWLPIIEAAAATQSNTPILDTQIATATGIDTVWVALRVAQYDAYRAQRWQETLDMLAAFGRGNRQLAALQRAAQQTAAALNNGLHIEEPARDVIDALQAEQMTTVHAVDLASLMTENKAAMEGDPVPGQPTGIALIDGWLGGGLKENEYVVTVAPYKSRKTSKVANVILAALKRGEYVNMFEFDESRTDFIYRLESILMAEYMWYAGEYDHPLNNIDSMMIRRAGKKWRTWPKPLPQAFEYAFDTLSSYGKRLNVYDNQTCDGTTGRIRALCRMDQAKQGLNLIVIDTLLQVSEGGTLFETVQGGSKFINKLRGELNCKAWVLTHMNEEGIKGGDTSGSHSPNAKGGGGPVENGDDIFVVKYKRAPYEDNDRLLKVELRQARYAESGVVGYVEIHPASGWITPRAPQTIDLQRAQDDALGPRE